MDRQVKTNQRMQIQPLNFNQSQQFDDVEYKSLDGIIGGDLPSLSGLLGVSCEDGGPKPQ